MYSPAVIAARTEQLLQQPAFRALFPQGLKEYSLPDCVALTAQILQARAEDGSARRGLTPEEEEFIASEQVKVGVDARHFLEAYTWIDEEGHGIRRITPLWESQEIVLKRLGDLQDEYKQDRRQDGILVNELKVRQVGLSTLGAALSVHRVLTQPYIRALVGSDVEEQAGYLFRMAHRVYQNLPYFLQPQQTGFNKNREVLFSNASSIKSAWGKSTRGALQEVGGVKGNLERGRTNSVVHISELASWDHPEQLDTSLMAGIPISPSVLVTFESTAALAGDWWHDHWLAAKKGLSRFTNIGVWWYMVPSKYSLRPPSGWNPSPTTLAMVEKIERESPKWMPGGETIHPTPQQLYWYEITRGYYEEKGNLSGFFREYPSDDEECFAYAGGTIFTTEQLGKIDAQARPLLDLWTVQPARDVAELRRVPEEQDALRQDRRPTPPVSVKGPRVADAYPVPQGYGFHRLPKTEIKQRIVSSDDVHVRFDGLLQIFEYPRARGERRYVISVDVGDGLGQDYSVATVVRLPTVEEIAEDVAQFVSNTLDTKQFTFVVDALGRLYQDDQQIEALAAIETNNHGLSVQDMLQLHMGYSNFYVWEYYNAATPEKRFSQRIGWSTTAATRPLLLSSFHAAITNCDPLTDRPDYRINSPITRQELRHFITRTNLSEAEAAPKQHDDAIFSSAIGYYVAYRLAGGEAEPLSERRRRKHALSAYFERVGAEAVRRDFRNTDVDAADCEPGGWGEGGPSDDPLLEAGVGLYFDPRNSDGE